MYEDLKEQTRNSFNELCETAQFKPGSLIVVGGSSSEVRGGVIGKDSSYEVGKAVTSTIIEEAGKRHLPASQGHGRGGHDRQGGLWHP